MRFASKRETVSLKLVLSLDNLLQKQWHFLLNLGRGSSKPQKSKWVRVIKIERESEIDAKHICVNNGMVFKFRFVAFTRNCVVMDTTNRPDKI